MEISLFYELDTGEPEYGKASVDTLQQVFDYAKKAFAQKKSLDFLSIDSRNIPNPFNMPEFMSEDSRMVFYDIMDYVTVKKSCKSHGLHFSVEDGSLYIMRDDNGDMPHERLDAVKSSLESEIKRKAEELSNILSYFDLKHP